MKAAEASDEDSFPRHHGSRDRGHVIRACGNPDLDRGEPDHGYISSILESQLLVGDAADGLPTILTIGGVGLSAPDPSIPGAHLETVLAAGSTVTVTGDGFCALTVINLFNVQGENVVNLGGLNPDGSAVIPLTFVDAQHVTFTLPAGAQSGAAYVMALNPPFTPFTSSGTDPGGAFSVP